MARKKETAGRERPTPAKRRRSAPAKRRIDLARAHARVVGGIAPLRVSLDVLRLGSRPLADEPAAGGFDEETAALYDEARVYLDAFVATLERAEARHARAA